MAYAVSFVGNEESKAVNLEAARKAMTLLKNDGILPLDPNAEQTILVCGRARAIWTRWWAAGPPHRRD